MTFRDELRQVINKHSQENGSNTPDFILAEFMLGCLIAFDLATNAREKWYGNHRIVPIAETPWLIDTNLYEGKFFYEIVKDTATSGLEVSRLIGPFPDSIRYTVDKNGDVNGFVQVIDGVVRQHFEKEQILVTDHRL